MDFEEDDEPEDDEDEEDLEDDYEEDDEEEQMDREDKAIKELPEVKDDETVKDEDTIDDDYISKALAGSKSSDASLFDENMSYGYGSWGNTTQNNLKELLETKDLLSNLEHLYRGDYQGPDSKGRMIWKAQKNKELITFNAYGVTSIMEIVSKYIHKNTILSAYTEERIFAILSDLGNDLITFIACNRVKMGMNTPFKRSKFRIIITTTLHLIESAYRRAIQGKTLEEVNKSKVVNQTEELKSGQDQGSGNSTTRGGWKRFVPGMSA